MESVTTYCQASYLLSGLHPNLAAYFAPNNRIQTTYCQAKLPTVRQSYLQSGKLHTVRHAPNRSIDMHPKGIDMHPKVSIDLHPTTAYFAPNRSIDMHPKGAYMHPKVAAYMHPKFSCLGNL